MKKFLTISVAIVLFAFMMSASKCTVKPVEIEAAPPTGEAATGFTFGKQAHDFHPETVDEFVPVFASQLARYSQTAPLLWPDNAVIDKTVVIEDVDTNRFWFIAADGTAAELSEDVAGQMGVSRRERPDDFSFYECGVYITVSDESVKNKFGWDKPHVGAYDSILWLTHEGFHKWEQSDKWNNPPQESIANSDRDEFFLDISARTKRNLLQKQIMQAVSEPGSTDLILDALATYENYKTQNADDYGNAVFFDRTEGTAKYYEFVSSLFIFYPEQISSKEDLDRAFTYLAQYEESYVNLGLVSESYSIGMFACVLLDRLDENWKERIMREQFTTPLEILSSHFTDKTLPEPKQLTKDEVERVTEDIRERVRFLVAKQIPVLTGIKQGLVDLPEEDRVVYKMYLNDMLRRFTDMITILPEEEQKAHEEFIRAMQE